VLSAEEWLGSSALPGIAGVVARRLNIPSSDLDDLDQELQIRVWKARAAGRLPAAWVFVVARNLAVDMKRARRRAALGDGSMRRLPSHADPELSALLRAKTAALPADLQLVWRLHAAGFSEREIAVKLDLGRHAVRNRLAWCRRFLAGRNPVSALVT
jgi:DNA-directed RNA polymerase specialized sigma24 family protein